MKLFCLSILLFAGAAGARIVASALPRQPITTSEIAGAISQTGLPVSAEQVLLLSPVTAANAEPVLKVESMEPMDSGRMRVRLNCSNHSECLPFFAVIKDSSRDVQLVTPQIQTLTTYASPRLQAGRESNPIVMHSGSPAVLLMDGGRVHIRVAVVSLESGSIGQSIHVVSKDHKKTYTAEVENSTTVRGQL